MAANLEVKKKFLEDFQEYCSLKGISKVSTKRMIDAYNELPIFGELIDASKPLSVPSLKDSENQILNNYYWNYIIDIQYYKPLKVYNRNISLGEYVEQLMSNLLNKIDDLKEVYRITHTCSGVYCPMCKGLPVNARSEICNILWNMGFKEAVKVLVFTFNKWLLDKIARVTRPIAYILCNCTISVSEQINSSFISSSRCAMLKPSECEKHGYDNVLEHEGIHYLCGHVNRGFVNVARRNAFERITREYPKTGFKYILLNEELKEERKLKADGNSILNR